MKVAERISGFLERNSLVVIIAWFSVFGVYRVSRYAGLISFNSDSSGGLFLPDMVNVAVFAGCVSLFFAACLLSMRVRDYRRPLLIFIACIAFLAGFTQLTQPGWVDAEGYYALGVLGAEKGPLYLIQNYHTLNTRWSEGFVAELERSLKGAGLYEFGMEKLKPEVGDGNIYSSRIAKHPPLWPVILSSFMILFGTSRAAALAAEWITASLVPVVIYFLLRMRSGSDSALRMSLLFGLVPAFVLSSSAPLLDSVVTLFVLLSAYFLVSGNDMESERRIALAGLFCGLAFFTKFIAVFAIAAFVLLLFAKHGWRKGLRRSLIFAFPIAGVSLVFMLLNYYFFLTIITAKVSETLSSGRYAKGLIFDSALTLYYLNYFGIVPVFMVLMFALRGLPRARSLVKDEAWLFVLLFAFLLVAYPIKVGIERHALPFFMLCSMAAARYMETRSGRKLFYAGFPLLILQALLLS